MVSSSLAETFNTVFSTTHKTQWDKENPSPSLLFYPRRSDYE